HTPSGMAITAVSPSIQAVPVHAVRIPALDARREGRLVRKSQSIRVSPWMRISPIKTANTITPKAVHAMPTYLNPLSIIRFVFMLRVFLLVPSPQPETQVVEQKRHHKQGNPCSEN